MIAVVDYGMGNIHSVMNALHKICANAKVVKKPSDIRKANAVIVPGVGSFDQTMENLTSFREDILAAVEAGTPYLGICMGLQALFEKSEEGKMPGLGVFKGRVVKLPETVLVPQMGWNQLKIQKNSKLLSGIGDGDFFYFVHSYHCIPEDASIVAATTDHGAAVVAAVEVDNIAAVQFHPEKSGEKGLLILENFLRETKC